VIFFVQYAADDQAAAPPGLRYALLLVAYRPLFPHMRGTLPRLCMFRFCYLLSDTMAASASYGQQALVLVASSSGSAGARAPGVSPCGVGVNEALAELGDVLVDVAAKDVIASDASWMRCAAMLVLAAVLERDER
jgi:hypothetical protein